MSSYVFWIQLAFRASEIGLISTLTVNVFLIYLILFKTKQLFGAYKYLIIAFSSMGIIFAVAEFIIKPITHNYNASFTFFTISRPFGCPTKVAKIFLAGYSSTYAATISLLAVQFIYRFFAIFDARKISLFRGCKLLYWILFAMIFGIDWSCSVYFLGMSDNYSDDFLRDEIDEKYSLNISTLAYFSAVVYDSQGSLRWRSTGVMLSVSKVVIIQYSIMIYCGTQIHFKMGEKLKIFSIRNRMVQRQLFKTLVVQITVPTCTVFLPVMAMFVLPFFALQISIPTGAILCALSIYPAMDGLIVICIISEYRAIAIKLLLEIFRRFLCQRMRLPLGSKVDFTSSSLGNNRSI